MAVERARAQIAEYQRFRALVRELIVVSERIADTELENATNVKHRKVREKLPPSQ
jgi:hypothetical protein